MIDSSEIDEYFLINPLPPLIDVRSPGEYEKGHILGATNIPLFTNEERSHVGTTYKQVCPEKAYEIGLNYVTPKLDDFIKRSEVLVTKNEPLYVHCWRGGQRSQAFAQYLSDNGIEHVKIINGGYKAYRNFVIQQFQKDWKLNVLGGYTGSGKTHILHELELQGEQVIDLEGLAKHKGSAFGTIKMSQQPSTEQFSNNLYNALRQMDHNSRIWLEDESMRIGQVQIPYEFFDKMKKAPTFFIDMEKELRAEILVGDYELDCDQELKEAIHRITRKLGGKNAKEAIELIDSSNYKDAALICLKYYDRLYRKGLEKMQKAPFHLQLDHTDPKLNAQALLEFAAEI
ncbi:MAG: tRNA 2-selenouridine synthase [Saprospiraceae bacterium]|jgi:tRNA 2-selenouridine synthase